jgi:hypothetical protein
MLASGPLLPRDLTATARFDARLVVASACESALSAMSDLPEEAVSIGTVLLASGSACAIRARHEIRVALRVLPSTWRQLS